MQSLASCCAGRKGDGDGGFRTPTAASSEDGRRSTKRHGERPPVPLVATPATSASLRSANPWWRERQPVLPCGDAGTLTSTTTARCSGRPSCGSSAPTLTSGCSYWGGASGARWLPGWGREGRGGEGARRRRPSAAAGGTSGRDLVRGLGWFSLLHDQPAGDIFGATLYSHDAWTNYGDERPPSRCVPAG
jgi:hypothetical protein